MAGMWKIPEEIMKEVSVVDLEDEMLYFYHDQMHVFWKKVEDGYVFGSSDSISDTSPWTFIDVFEMHKKTVIELFKRKLKHLSPINILDKISLVDSKNELVEVINYIKKE